MEQYNDVVVQLNENEYADYDPEVGTDYTYTSRQERPTGSTHTGGTDFFEEDIDDIGDATWRRVCVTFCSHTPVEWAMILVGVVILFIFLYFFLFALELLGTSAKVVGGCTAVSLFENDLNPIAALMIGLLSTALIQSSSASTSIIVTLVGSDLITVQEAIYMIMGANVGTTITNTIVAMGQMGDGDQLERAFAGATVDDLFNFLTLAILLPVEVITGYLYYLTRAMVASVTASEGESWDGLIKKLVSPLGDMIIIANEKLIEGVALGESCSDFYPVVCENPSNPTEETCPTVGLISCSEATGKCPAFFQPGASQHDDEVSGGVCFFIAIVILVICLIGLVSILQKLLRGMFTRILYKATNVNGYLAIAIGCGLTVLVQSSSITTSTLTPLVGMGVLHLERMYPLTLGANVGTTATALLASLVSGSVLSLQAALAHLMFNVTGIVIWYPLPCMRRVPLNAARKLGKATRIWRGFIVVYIVCIFILFPLILLGLATLFEQNEVGYTVLGVVLSAFCGLCTLYFIYWWRCKAGRESCVACMSHRQAKRECMRSLPEDMAMLKAMVAALADHTGLPEEEPVEEETEALVEKDVKAPDESEAIYEDLESAKLEGAETEAREDSEQEEIVA
jgi:sodium-dependent phosphate cotransporter